MLRLKATQATPEHRAPVSQGRTLGERRGVVTALLVAALAILVAASLLLGTSLGGTSIAPSDTLRYLRVAVLGGEIDRAEVPQYQIVWQIRAPRVLLAAVVGAALAASGAVIQAVVRNVLADPFLLGVSSGASVGAVSVSLSLSGFGALGLAAFAAASSTILVMAGAFLGALMASALAWGIATHGRAGASPIRLVLTGVVIAAGLQALMSVLIYAVPDTESTATVLFWTMGSFGAAAWTPLLPVSIVVVISLTMFRLHASTLDILAQGDETAAALGVAPGASRARLFAMVSLAAAAATATSGAVGFVGLIIPHIARMLVGASHRRVLLVAPLLGALLMVWVDVAARGLFPPRELPLSAITALVGVPVFIVLLRHRGRVLGA